MAVVLRRGLNIGSMSAEDDSNFLRECFVSTGDLSELRSMLSPKCVVVGRTGSGKSALLLSLKDKEENVIEINPESLSLNYISNSTIIQFFTNLGIDLDVFYQLLWRHVLAVELIKMKKQLNDEAISQSWIENLKSRLIGNQKKQKAIKYLFEYGESFWQDTEERVREVVTKIEKGFEDQIGINVDAFKAKITADLKDKNLESIQQTKEIVNKAQKVVNGVQLQELNSVMDLLSEDVFDDDQERFFIIIDDLDTGWVHDAIRFKLIRALIETIKKFRKVPNLKIIISLRADLLHTVLENTTAAGFQQEKYDDMFLKLRWNEAQLRELADKRVALLYRQQYTNATVSLNDMLAKKVGDVDAFSYIFERTLQRPRDVIAFLNQCLEDAAGQTMISHRIIRQAEEAYSRNRSRSLADEWREAYGDLEIVIDCLSNVEPRFNASDLTTEILENACLSMLEYESDDRGFGVFHRQCDLIASNQSNWDEMRRKILQVLYSIGAIGFKSSDGAPYIWSFQNQPTLNNNKITKDARFAIHPMLFKALGKYTDPRRLM